MDEALDGLADRPAPRAITVQSAQAIHAHQSGDAVLATGLAGLPEVQEDARGAVDALTRGERRADQAEQPGILLGPVRDWVREPVVVAARGDAEDATHRLDGVVVSIGLDELVRRANSPCAQLRGHRHRPPRLPGCYCPLNPGNSTRTPQGAQDAKLGPGLALAQHPAP